MDRPLFRARQLIREKARKVAAGEPIPLVHSLSKEVRTKICWAMADSSPRSVEPAFGINPSWSDVGVPLQRRLLKSWGRTIGLTKHMNIDSHADVADYVINGATEEEVLEVIEAWFDAVRAAISIAWEGSGGGYLPAGAGIPVEGPSTEEVCKEAFRRAVNEIFDLEDIGYQVVGTEVIERESMVMHAEVVAPVLTLLHGDQRFMAVERAYQDALRELKPTGNPADAITDAATALQEMLVASGAKGNALGPLMSDAIKKRMLRPYDAKLVDWASASRSDRGDAHSASEAAPEDAWLIVHVVGALLLRLEAHQPKE